MYCPSFVGPEVIDRTQIEFYCDVVTNETDLNARFEVYFTFDCEVDTAVPAIIVDVTQPRATLHERYLADRLGKTVRRTKSVSYSNTGNNIKSNHILMGDKRIHKLGVLKHGN